MKFFTTLFLALTLCAAPAFADEYTFGPDGCDFRMTFPEEPSTSMRCNPEKPGQCYKARVFNRVFSLDSGVKITVSCNPAEENMLERYSGEIMEYTLKSMVSGGEASAEKTGFTDYGEAKEATLLGQRTMPDGTGKIYMARLWIGKNSVMTVEGELIGPASNESDAMFTNIMKSVRLKSQDKAEEKEKADKE